MTKVKSNSPKIRKTAEEDPLFLHPLLHQYRDKSLPNAMFLFSEGFPSLCIFHYRAYVGDNIGEWWWWWSRGRVCTVGSVMTYAPNPIWALSLRTT
jgi:hypothetical protein